MSLVEYYRRQSDEDHFRQMESKRRDKAVMDSMLIIDEHGSNLSNSNPDQNRLYDLYIHLTNHEPLTSTTFDELRYKPFISDSQTRVELHAVDALEAVESTQFWIRDALHKQKLDRVKQIELVFRGRVVLSLQNTNGQSQHTIYVFLDELLKHVALEPRITRWISNLWSSMSSSTLLLSVIGGFALGYLVAQRRFRSSL